MNSSHLVRATALDGRVRAFALQRHAVVAELQERHGAYPAVAAALGRTAMGALLLAAASLKEEDQILTVEVRGDGPRGTHPLHRQRARRGPRPGRPTRRPTPRACAPGS